jgi:hypothetical protein
MYSLHISAHAAIRGIASVTFSGASGSGADAARSTLQ